MRDSGAALSLRGGEHPRAALLGSLVFHAAVVATIVLTARPGLERPPEPPRSIDLVSVEQLLPPPPPQAAPPEAAPLVSSPPPPAAPPAAAPPAAPPPEAAAPAPAAPGPALADTLTPATASSGGMTAQTGAGGAGTGPPAAQADESDYLPQFKITEAPVIPTKAVLSKIEYPPLAARQGIEATVFLELLIDATGKIRKVTVLKDPGYGFAQVAVAALQGVVCVPAKVEGQAVAVRYRYPVRFTLK